MRIGVLGINHRLATLSLREQLAKACSRRFNSSSALHPDHPFVLLSTCNRTEIYFSSDDLSATHSYLLHILREEVKEEFDQKLYSYFLVDCFIHLAKVTSGLDSAIVGETEIQGQVKHAYEASQSYQKLPEDLHFLFQKSLKIGKDLREKIQLRRGLPEIEHAIYSLGSHFFYDIRHAKLLFIGASEINWKILRFLSNKGLTNITLCNRTALPDVQTEEGIQTVQWEHLQHWHQWDLIIVGTKSQEYLLKKSKALNFITPKLVIDLSVPRNVDPALSTEKHLTLLNLEQINRTLSSELVQTNRQLCLADEHISQAIKKQSHIFSSKNQRKQLHFEQKLKLATNI